MRLAIVRGLPFLVYEEERCAAGKKERDGGKHGSGAYAAVSARGLGLSAVVITDRRFPGGQAFLSQRR